MQERQPTALNRMQSAVQLAAFHYICCLRARPANDDHHITFGTSRYTFGSIAQTPSNVLHSEFQQWAARVVLRDLIESFSLYLVELYQASVLPGQSGTAPISAEQFERRGLEDQLSAFAMHFGVDDAWISRLVAFNRARNCLAHRQGRVNNRDATKGKFLVVRWLTASVDLAASEGNGGAMADLIQGKLVAGQPAFLSVDDREKRFEVGSSLSLEAGDLLEICQTFHLAAAAFSTRQV